MDPRSGQPPTPSSRTVRQNTSEPGSSSSASPHSAPRQQNAMAQSQPPAASSSRTPVGAPASSSRPSGRAPKDPRPARNTSRDSLKPTSTIRATPTPELGKSEELFKALKSDFDCLRSLITCKICDRLLYEPYVIACGHTYCYSCLCRWFVDNKSRKTCPDCRTPVSQMPAPAYLIREMTQVFLSRAELLPPDETLEEHKAWQKEEEETVQRDKANKDSRTGGLFKGCFKSRSTPLRRLHDEEDGIERCPVCSWEIEGRECSGCGSRFDDNGTLTWANGFSGFSDMDETSEYDLESENPDAEMDMDDPNFMDEYYEDEDFDWEEDAFIHRWLSSGGQMTHAPQFAAAAMPRRRAAHSAAGSRRARYTASLASEMLTEDAEMDTLEEEDEEDLDDEDSSMNDFIVEDESEDASQDSTSSQATSHHPGPTRRLQGRNRHVIDSEASSSASRETGDDENEEDEGPVAPGRRGQLASRQPRARRRFVVPSSSSATDASLEELDEDTEALLREQAWSPLGPAGPDDEMDEDDYDSDGGRTEVGWGPIANSNERSRLGGSLTPTADRPHVPIRPPSRVGNSRRPDGSRGLRRRSSTMTVSTVNYEDGEADDDDSDIDRDGDIQMNGSVLRNRRSSIRLRGSMTPQHNSHSFANRNLSMGNPIEPDSDDASDNSVVPARGARRRRDEYNPRISYIFSQFQRERMGQSLGQFDHFDQRASTPIARPRTANRNRANPQAVIPSTSSTVVAESTPAPGVANPVSHRRTPSTESVSTIHRRTPSTESSSTQRPPNAPVASPNPPNPNPNAPPPQQPNSRNEPGANRTHSVISISSTESSTAVPSSPGSTRHSFHPFANSPASHSIASPHSDVIDRPISRLAARPPSATGRRSGNNLMSPFQPPVGAGSFLQRALQGPPPNPSNPFYRRQLGQTEQHLRPAASRRELRDQSSTATLRPQPSRRLRPQPSQIAVREAYVQSPTLRQQASRLGLRSQPSHRRLNSQASNRTLRGSDGVSSPQSPATPSRSTFTGVTRPGSNLPPEEVERLARAVVQQRRQVLAANANNPYLRPERIVNRDNSTGVVQARMHTLAFEGARETAIPLTSTQSPTSPIGMNSPPTLSRRRSNRSLGLPPGVILPQSPNSNAYIYARSGRLPGSAGYEAQINPAFTRNLSSIIAAGDRPAY